MTAVNPTPFQPGARLIDGSTLNSQFDNPVASSENGITAYAGGGATNATALTATVNNIATCATNADSVKLTSRAAGSVVHVKNSGSANLALFPPAGGATLNGATTATTVNSGTGVTCLCVAADVWVSY